MKQKYYCPICKYHHFYDSKIGRQHINKSKKSETVIGKKEAILVNNLKQAKNHLDNLNKKYKHEILNPNQQKEILNANTNFHIKLHKLYEYMMDHHPKEKLYGGLADRKDLRSFNPEQLMLGVLIELEHTNNPYTAMEIASDHLAELWNYYDPYLEDMEEKAGVKNK